MFVLKATPRKKVLINANTIYSQSQKAGSDGATIPYRIQEGGIRLQISDRLTRNEMKNRYTPLQSFKLGLIINGHNPLPITNARNAVDKALLRGDLETHPRRAFTYIWTHLTRGQSFTRRNRMDRTSQNASDADIVTIKPPSEAAPTKQGLSYFFGISGETVGSSAIAMNLVEIPPNASAKPHFHQGYETAIYLLKGRVETAYGLGLKKSVVNEAGEFLYIPANVPHQPRNLSDSESALAIVARNDANQQESVIPYNPNDV